MYMKKRMLFLVNPNAGKKNVPPKVCDIVNTFINGGYEVTLHISQGVHDIYNTIKEKGYYDCIVCSGGDGSLNEMIRACIEIGYKEPIGYIPAGTVNDFAKTLKLEMDPRKSAKRIVSGDVVACDVGSLNDMKFMYIAAFGALSDVSYTTPQEAKNILGPSAYILEGLKQLFDLRKYAMHIEYDGNILEDTFCLGIIGNTKSVGGSEFFKKEDVDLSDGLFECMFIKYPSNVKEYQQIVTAILTNEYKMSSNIIVFKTKNIKVVSNKLISWTIDGEFAGEYKEVNIKNLHRAVKLLR